MAKRHSPARTAQKKASARRAQKRTHAKEMHEKSASPKIPMSSTSSVCPECLGIIKADIFERDGKVWIEKTCKKHGHFEELYWGSKELYDKAKRFAHDGKGIENPNVDKKEPVCPKDCGLCNMHKSHTALANLVLTNRCDLSCWYCFFYAKRMGYVYEPTMQEFEGMIKTLVSEKPVACNAVQLSVDAAERIFVKNPNGLVLPERIGDFIDRMMERQNPTVCSEPIMHERLEAEGFEVLTTDEKKNIVFSPIKSLIRHENSEELFRINTDCGWNITTTGAHSVFVLDGSETVPKPVSDIRAGDTLLGSLDFPFDSDLSKINLLELIEKWEPETLKKIVVCGFPEDSMKHFESIEGRRIGWESVAYSTYMKSGKKLGSKIRYFNSIKGKELPIELEVTPELCRLLGYYVGEGCTYRNGVIFTFSLKEKELVADFEFCLKKVFGNTHFRKIERHGTAVQIYIEGYLYKTFFGVLGAGKSAREKRIPWMIFNVREQLQKEFLKAYFMCDGNVKTRKSGFEIDHNTVSTELAKDIVWLHLKFGITPKIETSISKPHLVKKTGQFIRVSSKKFRIVIGGKEDLKKSLWYLDGEVRKKFEEYASSEEKHSPSYMRFPIIDSVSTMAGKDIGDGRISYLLKRMRHDDSVSKATLEEVTNFFNENHLDFDKNLNDLSHSGLGFFKVREIEKVKPSSRYVYDISVPSTQAFFAGFGPLMAHNTGGEPTLREDLVDVIKMCKSHGLDHIQVNTNGIRLSKDLPLIQKLRENGVNTLYLSFDGVTAKTNPKNHWEIPGVLDNCRKADNMGAVLVPTIIKGINDHEAGDILRFGFNNNDVVRGVNFQPVSLVGKITHADRARMRITIPDLIQKLEEQTDGQVGKEDFYPVPTPWPFTRFVQAMTGKPKYELSSHFACGMATYIFNDNGKMIPITRFVDVEGMLEYLDHEAEGLEKGGPLAKLVAGPKLLFKLGSFIDNSKAPKGFSLKKILWNALMKHNYKALGEFHHKSLFVGMMHFQDLYNYDIERVKRCTIHYAMSDGRIVPFCAFNVIPQWYRDKDMESQGLSFPKWEKKTGMKLSSDIYKRDEQALASTELYKKTYGKQ